MPANSSGSSNGSKVRPLNDREYDLLTFCEQFFMLNGRLPNSSEVQKSKFTEREFYSAIRNGKFNRGLEQRGIVPYATLNSKNHVVHNISAKQVEVANTMLDLVDNRSKKKKLADLDVSSQVWQAWLRNPAFSAYLRIRSEHLLTDSQQDAHLSLLARVNDGDISAIKYYNEITGRYTPATSKGIDVHEVLFKVLEVIQKRVSDPEVQAAVAKELMGIADPISAQFNGQPVNQFRELTAGPDGSYDAFTSDPNSNGTSDPDSPGSSALLEDELDADDYLPVPEGSVKEVQIPVLPQGPDF